MTDGEPKAKILAEIERLREECSIGLSAYDMGVEDGKIKMCIKLRDFINSMPEEPVSEELEEAADKALDTFDVAGMMCGSYEGWQMLEMFKAGAQWQKQRIIDKAVGFLNDVDTRNYEAFDSDSRTYYMDNDELIEDFKKALEKG